MLEELGTAAVLVAFAALLGLVHAVAFARATRARESQLRQPRYWGR